VYTKSASQGYQAEATLQTMVTSLKTDLLNF
jgi:hypothetical protein